MADETNQIENEKLGRAGFGKQRRNLLVISTLMASGIWVGVSFEPLSEITFLSNKFLLTRPDNFFHVIWIMWFYFLFRYMNFHLKYQECEEKFWNIYSGRSRSAQWEAIHPRFFKEYENIKPSDFSIDFIRTTFLGASSYIRTKKYDGKDVWSEPIRFSVNPAAIWGIRIKCLAATVLREAVTSEYFLPYIVAILPVVLCILRSNNFI